MEYSGEPLPDGMDAGQEEEARPEELSALDKLMKLANAEGDISHAFTSEDLTKIGADVVRDYDMDKTARQDWEDQVVKALAVAAQEKAEDKTFPWAKSSNVKYPMLTIAALQFNARAYPAIVKGDEAVSVKVVGRDAGKPRMGRQGPLMGVQGPDGQVMPIPPGAPPPPPGMPTQPIWEKEPGAKGKRAKRVADYMNTTMFYRIEGWEEDTDQLLLQLPIVGCCFRKVCQKDGAFYIRMVPALKLVAPVKARDVASSPRLTEEMDDVYPYEIDERMAQGFYRKVELMPEGEDDQAPRLLLEQHRLMDLDEDGISEPYIITVDKETSEVLRIESNFSPAEALKAGGKVTKLSVYYIKYDFFPHPNGEFYGIGFGHLLEPLTESINASINQLNDAATAANAGGGFIASGVRLQGNGTIRFGPGEYKTINGVTGSQLRESIWERTIPNPSPVTFQLLDMMLSAAKDITSVKDVVTGEASNQGQVGTTMALIEQSLAVFSAIYKRVYRSLKAEFALLYEGMGKWGGEEMAADYAEVLDDPEADFQADFNAKDMDIRPISDPGAITKTQRMVAAQFLLSVLEPTLQNGGDGREIMRRVYEAANVEDIDKIFPPPKEPQMSPIDEAKVAKDQSSAELNTAKAQQTQVETALMPVTKGFEMGIPNAGPAMGGQPGNEAPPMQEPPQQPMPEPMQPMEGMA